MGSSETTFYILTIYFGAVQIKKIRHTLVACLLADAAGISDCTRSWILAVWRPKREPSPCPSLKGRGKSSMTSIIKPKALKQWGCDRRRRAGGASESRADRSGTHADSGARISHENVRRYLPLARLPGGRRCDAGRGADGRVRRSGNLGRVVCPRRVRRHAAVGSDRFRRHPPQSQGVCRLQRHHGASHRNCGSEPGWSLFTAPICKMVSANPTTCRPPTKQRCGERSVLGRLATIGESGLHVRHQQRGGRVASGRFAAASPPAG